MIKRYSGLLRYARNDGNLSISVIASVPLSLAASEAWREAIGEV